MSNPILTAAEEKSLVYAANVVGLVHQTLFGTPCGFFWTAEHGWDNIWYVCVHDHPGQVSISSLN